MKNIFPHAFLFVKDYRTMTSGWQRAPYFRRYDRGLVSKPAISMPSRMPSAMEHPLHSRGHRCRPFSPPVVAYNFYGA